MRSSPVTVTLRNPCLLTCCSFDLMLLFVSHHRCSSRDELRPGSEAVFESFDHHACRHLNPAVTFGTLLTGHISLAKGALYIVAQISAAIIGTLLTVRAAALNGPCALACSSPKKAASRKGT